MSVLEKWSFPVRCEHEALYRIDLQSAAATRMVDSVGASADPPRIMSIAFDKNDQALRLISSIYRKEDRGSIPSILKAA